MYGWGRGVGDAKKNNREYIEIVVHTSSHSQMHFRGQGTYTMATFLMTLRTFVITSNHFIFKVLRLGHSSVY